ncbi:hypothetical protein GRO01_15260 [Gluconobacter roseus NBRC 3990]|uniref:Uncharacterized protein n=1 Tax=Gluconobacter roseus NBRC 3990 TaxID=1307950 RepID=A0A4Y3M3W6_9PROT|nr:hypothetical protein GRO01_15260 [Gluconobacter roseus NBRC 3990]
MGATPKSVKKSFEARRFGIVKKTMIGLATERIFGKVTLEELGCGPTARSREEVAQKLLLSVPLLI